MRDNRCRTDLRAITDEQLIAAARREERARIARLLGEAMRNADAGALAYRVGRLLGELLMSVEPPAKPANALPGQGELPANLERDLRTLLAADAKPAAPADCDCIWDAVPLRGPSPNCERCGGTGYVREHAKPEGTP